MAESATISRRTLAKGAAWSVPVVAAAATAPAYAASRPCTYTTLNWNTRVSATSATTTVPGVTATATLRGGTRADTGYSNMFPETLTIGSFPEYSGSKWLRLATGGANSQGETITVSGFSAPIYCVSFYIQDIDTQYSSASNRYRDAVSVTGFTASTSSQYVAASGSTATSSTTATSTSSSGSWSYTSSTNGLAKFTYTSSTGLSSITINYTNPVAGSNSGVNDNNMQVWVSPIKYSTNPCNCL